MSSPEFTEEWFHHEISRLARLLRPVRRYFHGRVLDVGTCHGAALRLLESFGCTAVGTDVDGTYLAWCASQGLDVRPMDLGGSLPFDNGEFDVVLASHVLEHIEAPHPALREFQRVLRPGGRLVLIVPNAEGYSGGYAPYHMNYYSPTTVLQSVRVAGFTPQLITTDMPLAGTLDSRWRIRTPLLPGNLARRWQRRILRFLPAYHAGGNLYCVADKRQPGSPIASGRKT